MRKGILVQFEVVDIPEDEDLSNRLEYLMEERENSIIDAFLIGDEETIKDLANENDDDGIHDELSKALVELSREILDGAW